jgi:putative hemolysin
MQAVLPEDEIVPISIEAHIPAVELSRRSRFSVAMAAFASSYCFNLGEPHLMPEREGLLSRILGFLR